MKRLFPAALSLLIVFIGLLAGCSPDSSTAELKQEVRRLRTENEQLKNENQALAKAALQSGVTAPASFQTDVSPPTTKTPEAKYWMTISSSKRHNSSCRYFMNSKGRLCGPNEGIPCKLCGG